MKASGVRCVLGVSFARIFSRNCINLGLPVIACPEAALEAARGDEISVDVAAGKVVVAGKDFTAPPLPPFMLDMLERGGLIPWAQNKLSQI